MDNSSTIFNMEASLLQTRIKNWYFKNVGRDITLFQDSNQEDTIQHALRFTNSLYVALDLTGELINCVATIKFLFANTLRMIERRAKAPNTSPSSPSFIQHIRKKFTSSLNLFRFLISPAYRTAIPDIKPTLYDSITEDELFVWGESLLGFAECSLKYWKPQYILVLKTAEDRLAKCITANPRYHQAQYALGNVLLLQAKNEVLFTPPFLALVHRAKDAFFSASLYLLGVKAYNFNFIRACALLGQEQELSQLLPSFLATFPEEAPVLADSDFDHYRTHRWFQVLEERISNPAKRPGPPHQPFSAQQPLPHAQPSPLPQPPQKPQQLPVSPQKPPQLPQQTQQKPQQPQQTQPLSINDPSHPLNNIADYELMNSYPPPIHAYPELPYLVYPDPYAYQPMSTIPPPATTTLPPVRVSPPAHAPVQHRGKAGIEDKQYGALQSSLIESGFSIKRLLEVFSWLPVSSGILQPQPEEENEHVKKQKLRLQQRLELYQLKPKREIPGDGNCQMHAVSDQLYDTIDRSKDVRKTVVEWLRKNKNWKLPNGSLLHEFVHDKPWDEYCDAMAKDGCWGDHLTLLAISEIWGAVISIMSSVEGDNFITEIHPTQKKTNKVILLSHYAEFHYGSLTHIGETLK